MNDTLQPVLKQNSRGEARRRAMLDATWQILSEKGFAAVTLNDVISRSGGSRTTLYEAFGGKDGLIASVLTEKCQEFSEILQTSLGSDLPPREALLNFTIIMTEKCMDEESIRIMSFLQLEMDQFPGIRETFMKNGPEPVTARITAFFQHQHDMGTMNVPDPEFTARMFLTMIQGQWRDIVIETAPPRIPSKEEMIAKAHQLIDLLFNGISNRKS
ncbi:TetR/AcrR family transcriptional regulator [Thalassospira marina]|uniref:TetR family transcriptional regulator n=1 Tax=Thalassospira marina TaxID=2048283 RepID=A0A2N3L025_9PROT|nr:TetR/AcrR family transcriptional regulator [Thalassospira marina]AUG52145.1 TetR family transcriptional regulator [Thalassospira marina]PKR56066.1 TetR family transcriptional regulator [Thalassospira marina]